MENCKCFGNIYSDMFDLWTDWNAATDSQKNTEIDRHTGFIT